MFELTPYKMIEVRFKALIDYLCLVVFLQMVSTRVSKGGVMELEEFL